MKLSLALFLSLPVTLTAFQPHYVRPSSRVVVCHSSSSSNNNKKNKKNGLELPKSFDVSSFFNEAEKARDELKAQTMNAFQDSDTRSATNNVVSNKSNNNFNDQDNKTFDMNENLDMLRGRFDEFRSSLLSTSSSLFDFSKIMDSSDAIRENVLSGTFGQRGEYYVLAQLSLMAFIVVGGIPVLGDLVTVVLGPGLLLTGLATMVLAVQEMGGSLSPWPTTNERTELVTDGVFGSVRHPIYAGLLAALAGLSLVTGSALRLLLTVALWYVLEEKSQYEEEQLHQAFPGKYAAYTQQVPGKFIPSDWSLDTVMSAFKQDDKNNKP